MTTRPPPRRSRRPSGTPCAVTPPARSAASLADDEARQCIRSDLDRTLIVEAAAGTGKTTELVRRIIAVLADGRTSVDRVVAVTFTEKAAGELKLRLRTDLEDARQALGEHDRSRSHLDHALVHLEEAHVNTIHGFCADLLRARSVAARVDPQFRTASEAEAARLYGEAFDRWLPGALENPPEGVRRSLRRQSRWHFDEGPAGRLRSAGWMLAAWRDFPTAWRRDPFDRRTAIERLLRTLEAFAGLTDRGAGGRDRWYHATEPARRLRDEIRAAEAVRARDLDWLEAALVALANDGPFARGGRTSGEYAKGLPRAAVAAAHAELLAALRSFARTADADLAALLHHELEETTRSYEALKARNGQLDFVDLLVRARDLVRDDDGVRRDFQQRFTHFFVDEFQDTDPLQAEILLLLAAADPATRDWRAVDPVPGKLFLVGDPKQSIYRFRRADVGIYHEVKALLERRGALTVHLRTSFRSVPTLQHAVNAAFAPLMTGDPHALQADYVPLAPWRPARTDQPALVVLPVPQPYGAMYGVTAGAIERSLPDAVGAFVHWLVTESDWTVTERERPGEAVAVAPRHICLLFRRFESWGEDVTRAYVKALEARGIAHLLVGGRSFHAREEVETVRAALTAVEWPDDELAVYATLRGSLFAISDEVLLAYRHRFGRLHPFRIPPQLTPGGAAAPTAGDPLEAMRPIADALALLQSLHRRRNRRPAAETVSRLLEFTRAHAAFVLRPSGEQVLANVFHIAELARAYEAGGGVSFRGFVEHLRDEAARNEAPEAPILEEGSDGVRLMTVHKAKGLEFPVVILADLTAKLARATAGRYVDPQRRLCAQRIAGWSPAELLEHEVEEVARDTAEGVRIAYVAATRARDLLVVPAVGDGPFANGWLSPLDAAVYPDPARRRHGESAPRCPRFGRDSVLVRPGGVPETDVVRPGLHHFVVPGSRSTIHDARSTIHGYSVVWWDPAVLPLDVAPRFGLRQEELLGTDADHDAAAADLAAFRAWQETRAAALEQGVRPTCVVQTATERAAQANATDAAVTLVELPTDPSRPAGPRFGTLVHAVLATVPLDGDAAAIIAAATLQGRILGAPPDETTAAASAVAAVLAHPLLRRAATAERRRDCRRETPVTLRATDGTIVDGVVDLAFHDDGTWTVIDFKTDRELADALPAYRRQLGLYAAAIAAATGAPVSAVLMKV
jgi:ATP-dependent exoDNAse (exonuclease V) beta subunit